MDTRKHMIIIKGEIKTSNVNMCKYNPTTKKADIEFDNGKIYSYAYSNVEWIENPNVLSPDMYQISKDGNDFYDVEVIYVFKGKYDTYWHVCFSDGKERDYSQGELDIRKSCLVQSQAKDLFEYIKQIAYLSDLKNEETGEKILAKRFEKISFVGDDVVLAKYLDPSKLKQNNVGHEAIPIFPFGCNNSQYKAVKNAMENQISVIQGPPGTGKTQTILNIIANILLQGKTVQIVSNNNSATDNVYEKLSSTKYNLGFIAAMLGNSNNKKTFIDGQNGTYPDFTTWKSDGAQNNLQKDVYEKSMRLKTVFNKQEELANLKQEQAQLTTEAVYFSQYVGETGININSVEFKKNLAARQWMALWQECQRISEIENKTEVWLKMNLFKLKVFLKYGVLNLLFHKHSIGQLITMFQAMYYRGREAELTEKIAEIEDYLKSVDGDLLNDLCRQSMVILKDKFARKYEGNANRKVFDEDDLWKNHMMS